MFFTKKPSNTPVTLSSFTSRSVYSISFAKVTSKDSTEKILLLACDGERFVYYTQKPKNFQYEPNFREVKHLSKAASLAVNAENIVAVGNGNGILFLCDMSNDFKVIRSMKIATKKYIGHMSWFNMKLAVCADDDIQEYDLSVDLADPSTNIPMRKATGHPNRICKVRYNKSGSLMVTCCFKGQIRVWNTQETDLTCVSTYSTNVPQVFTVIFLPINEDVIVYGGFGSSVYTYKWTEYPAIEAEAAPKKQSGVVWGKISEEILMIANCAKRKVAVKVGAKKESAEEGAEGESEIVKMENLPVS